MTDTITSTDLGTPADVAAAVLDAIEAHPDAFSMSNWCRLPGGTPLPPRVAPPSGATLCAAAWVAHFTGWTLVDADDLVQVTVHLPGGFECCVPPKMSMSLPLKMSMSRVEEGPPGSSGGPC